jgi:hypothetical protein
MKVIVTKRQFKLLLNNMNILTAKGFKLEMTVEVLNYVMDL